MSRITLLGCGGPAFTPPTSPPTTNLRIWLKADAITGVSNGAGISSWIDSSGVVNGRVMPALAAQPTYVASGINGKPSVRFNGSTQGFGDFTSSTPVVSDLAGTGNQYEIAIVFQADAVSATEPVASWLAPALVTDSGGNVGVHLAKTGVPVYKIRSYLYAGDTFVSRDFTLGSPTRFTTYRDTSNDTVYASVNDGSFGSLVIANDSASTQRFWIGRNYTQAAWFQGLIAEILIWSAPLSASDRQQARDYLYYKYGV